MTMTVHIYIYIYISSHTHRFYNIYTISTKISQFIVSTSPEELSLSTAIHLFTYSRTGLLMSMIACANNNLHFLPAAFYLHAHLYSIPNAPVVRKYEKYAWL